jgi:dimethylargininase
MTRPAYQFNSIIVRSPSRSVVNGLRAEDRGSPTYEGVKAEHDAYVEAVRDAGVKVTVLPALETLPDSIFVEDPALVFTEGGGPASAGSGHARQGSRGNRADAA